MTSPRVTVSESNPTTQVTIVKSEDPIHPQSNITLFIEVSDFDQLYRKAKEFEYEISYEIHDEPWKSGVFS